ncbi:RrF2 family transcriptional regulator [Metaclostridioides mangenotii]|uniref:RrF2 family transcriptional regulator n=1 Tax=Metaclostridioides mangenotii TaxID=1540 RepID=UPI000464EB05|nr:Rrf2 family transcriptional regulator [Clostridioides mangenotii]
MKITREVDYGIRTIRALADGETRTIKFICDNENIPIDAGYKVFRKLKENNIISISVGAKNGGYKLLSDTKQTTLLDVISALDDDIFINDCLEDGFNCANNTGDKVCMVNRELCRIQKIVMNEMSKYTLYEVLTMYDEKNTESSGTEDADTEDCEK